MVNLVPSHIMTKIGINITTGSLRKEEMIVGIDLGTTNSLVAIIHPETKTPIALKEHNSSSLVPSIIYFDENNQIIDFYYNKSIFNFQLKI